MDILLQVFWLPLTAYHHANCFFVCRNNVLKKWEILIEWSLKVNEGLRFATLIGLAPPIENRY